MRADWSTSWRNPSARTRLTLWYVALMAGTLVSLITLGLWLVQRQLYANADQVLRSKAAAVLTELDVSNKGKVTFDAEGIKSGTPPTVGVGLDSIRIQTLDGRLVYGYAPGGDLPALTAQDIETATIAGEHFATLQTANGELVRSLIQPFVDKGKAVGVIQVGRSQADVDTLLSQMRRLGLLGMLVGLVVAWAGGSFLARRVLKPVDRIREAAERIGAQDLSMRLELPGSDDELGRLAHAFNNMIDRLDRAFQQQQRFTADASHELRTPLTVIRSLAEVALESPRDEAYDRSAFTSICDESERLGRLVERLLVLARADQGQELQVETVELDDLLIDAATVVAPTAGRLGVSLTVGSARGEQVLGDAGLLTQLLVNLLENALRHTPSGGEIALSAETVGRDIALRVSDSGEGIEPEHLPRLFDRFYRVDRARSRGTGGFGLGLAICQWIVKAHHGEISVTSLVGVGTTFEARLPRQVRASECARPPALLAAIQPEHSREREQAFASKH